MAESYARSDAGNMTAGPRPNAEADGSEGLLLVYDAWNRLTEAYADNNENGIPDTGEEVGQYEYDGLHRRTRRQDKHSFASAKDFHYYYDTRWRVLEVRDADASTHAYKQYVWDIRYIDAPILRDRETDGGSAGLDERLYYTQDGNFNVTALINTDGTVAERIIYSPYGQPTFLKADWTPSNGPDGQNNTADDGTASDCHNAILYCGYRFDPETGLYHVRHRYLHPTLGRWITQDPLGYVDGMGLYEYCMSRVISMLDPLGLASDSEFKRFTDAYPSCPYDSLAEIEALQNLDHNDKDSNDKGYSTWGPWKQRWGNFSGRSKECQEKEAKEVQIREKEREIHEMEMEVQREEILQKGKKVVGEVLGDAETVATGALAGVNAVGHAVEATLAEGIDLVEPVVVWTPDDVWVVPPHGCPYLPPAGDYRPVKYGLRTVAEALGDDHARENWEKAGDAEKIFRESIMELPYRMEENAVKAESRTKADLDAKTASKKRQIRKEKKALKKMKEEEPR